MTTTKGDGFDARANLYDVLSNPSAPTAEEIAGAKAALCRMNSTREAWTGIEDDVRELERAFT